MDIKILVTDLDDTLISHKSGLTKRTIDAIEKTKQYGIKTVIATGRMHASAFTFAEKLGLAEPIISYNGALIKHMLSNEVIAHYPVNFDYAREVLRFAEAAGSFIQYYSTDNYYVRQSSPKSERYFEMTGLRAIETGKKLSESIDFEPTKLLLIADDEAQEEILLEAAKKEFDGKLNVVRSSKRYIEFNNLKASKGRACKALADYYGYKLENIMSIGNGGNDAEMLKMCGFGVAVENSVPEALAAADYICKAQDKDGVAEAIERFLLKR
ncbi:MAG: HAD family phosphatase [Clostridia bacterium]|nr:HAD family phosphatase [Clostridia bacterium]